MINLIKAEAAVGSGIIIGAPFSSFSGPAHFNINQGGSSVYGGGLQDIARVLIATHQHVDYDLFINGGLRHGSLVNGGYNAYFPSLALAHSLTNNFANDLPGFSYTVGSTSWDQTNIYDIASNSPTGAYFYNLLDYFAWYLYHLTNDSFTGAPDYHGFSSDASIDIAALPPHWIDPNNYFNHNTRTYSSQYLPTAGTLGYGQPDIFGFYGFTIFGSPLSPHGILLVGDVGGNRTFAEHIADSSIHYAGGNYDVLPDVEITGDALAGFSGFLNVYDSVGTGLTQSSSRVGDAYPTNTLDTWEEQALEKVSNTNTDPAHPMLYEEGIYLWHNHRARLFKTIKADPDDITLMVARSSANPMDSLFIGAESSDIFSQGEEVLVAHEHFDTYFYNNYYRWYDNFEYNDSDPALSVHMWDGLGYQSNNGFIVGY